MAKGRFTGREAGVSFQWSLDWGAVRPCLERLTCPRFTSFASSPGAVVTGGSWAGPESQRGLSAEQAGTRTCGFWSWFSHCCRCSLLSCWVSFCTPLSSRVNGRLHLVIVQDVFWLLPVDTCWQVAM